MACREEPHFNGNHTRQLPSSISYEDMEGSNKIGAADLRRALAGKLLNIAIVPAIS